MISPLTTAPAAWLAGSWVVSSAEAGLPYIDPIVVAATRPGITQFVRDDRTKGATEPKARGALTSTGT
jgi:hypothetical protein